MTPRLTDVAAVLVDQQNRAAYCVVQHQSAVRTLAEAEEQRKSSATPIGGRLNVAAAREQVERWGATTRAVLDDFNRFAAHWHVVQQQFPAANDEKIAGPVPVSGSKPDTLVKLLKLGALDKGAIYEITGWPMAAVEATIAFLLDKCRITYLNGNMTRTYCVLPS